MSKLFFLVVASATFLFACKKNSTPTPYPGRPQNPNDPSTSPSVYIAGDSFDLSTSYTPHAVYWKNNKQYHLPNQTASSGTGIVVSDTNVYVSSWGGFYGNDVTYWKNGLGLNLADPSVIAPTANSITISGNDIYTTGGAYINNYEKFVSIYFKNLDKAVKIDTGPSHGKGEGRGIAVVGNDIYIAGSGPNTITNSGSPPCYWRNGTPTFLSSITPSNGNGMAKSIFVSGTDIHVVGEVYPVGSGSSIGWAVYWKNGTPTELTQPNLISQANCVTVVGNDVYIAGAVTGADRQLHATYWKNGHAVTLDAKYSVANSIVVYENDVYVAGNRGVDTALYWKNGNPVLLGRGRANAIAVIK